MSDPRPIAALYNFMRDYVHATDCGSLGDSELVESAFPSPYASDIYDAADGSFDCAITIKNRYLDENCRVLSMSQDDDLNWHVVMSQGYVNTDSTDDWWAYETAKTPGLAALKCILSIMMITEVDAS